MHELSICQSLIRQIEALAKQHRAQAITRVTLQIGPLSGVVPELLEQAFSVARHGSLAESSRLVTLLAPIQVRCEQCGMESEAVINRLICGHCGGERTQLISGNEMQLVSVELTGADDTLQTSATSSLLKNRLRAAQGRAAIFQTRCMCLKNEEKRKSHFSLCVLKKPMDGLF